MELIANLGRSYSGDGITPQKLQRLEQVFRDAAGGGEEINLEGFKKIVHSKNGFFVERIFHVFDADNSGTVSLEEFMRVMHCFANQSPIEKLRYLFEIYDINNDGNIEFCELRNVISECMKENGLQFNDVETDELTKMLFDDADTDASGTITFEEFQSQLERQPAFMENLTLSLERWLLPNVGGPKKPSKNPWNLQRAYQRIRNNWTSIVYLFFYFAINVALFRERMYAYRESNTYVILARACGQCLNFNCAFIVIPVLRQCLTWLRTHGYSKYLPIDNHIYYHKLTGCMVFIFSMVHTTMHVGNFNKMAAETNITLSELLISTDLNIGWVGGAACLTGWILLLVLVVMCISAMPFVRRNGKFEVFYFLHLLFIVFWICLIVHGPNFWAWFVVPGILFVIETAIRVSRNLSNSNAVYVQQGVLLPSKVTHLVIKRPPKFDYKPGDYVYVNIPSIAKFEWHPFTISSAPELDDVIWLHIRGVGEWTNSLYDYFIKEDKEAILSEELSKNMEMLPNFFDCGSISSGNGRPGIPEIVIDKASLRNDSFLSRLSSQRYIPNTITSKFNETFTCESSPVDLNSTYVKGRGSVANDSIGSGDSGRSNHWRRTSFTSTSLNRAVQMKNKEDRRLVLAESNLSLADDSVSRKSVKRDKRKSVRVSVAKRGLRGCQTVIIMPTVSEEDEEDSKLDMEKDKVDVEERKYLKPDVESENVVVTQNPLKIFLDGPYGTPTRHIFQARHAVLIGTGIGVTPFASILQSIMYQYRKSRHTCPSCSHSWTDPLPVSSMRLKKVDFFWLNRHQRSFEWFVNLLSELEVEQAQQASDSGSRFLDIHMYITSALHPSDMKAVGLQMALDLLYQKEKRCLITGLKSRTQPGRPDWNKVFTSISQQKKGKVTVFFCGPNQLAKTLQSKCDEFGFSFRKEIF